MRYGITGLVAGFVAGAVLAGGAAFAVSTAQPISARPGSTSGESVRVASQLTSRSVDPTATAHASSEASASRHPSVASTQSLTPHRNRERVVVTVTDPATQAPHRTPAAAPTPSATTQNRNHEPDGTVCAPVTAPVADPVVVPTPAPGPCVPPSTPVGEGEHHEGSDHE